MPRKRKVNVPPPVAEEDSKNARPSFLNDPHCTKLLEIVLEAQKNDSYHGKCSKQLVNIYDKFQHKTFMLIIIHCIKMALVQHEDNEYGNCQLNFWARALTSFDSSEDTHQVLADSLNWLLDSISADSTIRFRMCSFTNALLNAMGPEAQLDDNICNSIQAYMIERMRDINQNVRLQAVYALQRLQNPDDSEDKVIQVYMFHIDNDPSPKVRQAVITAVAKNKKTIPYIIGRLWDVDEKVRRHTILQMSKYPVRQYMVAQRSKILEQGLKDQSSLVKQALTKVMLPHWIESYQKNFIHFLEGLKIDATDEELVIFKRVSTEALMEVFKKFPWQDALKNLSLNETEPMEKCVPVENLTVESVVLWQAIIKYLKDNDTDEIDIVLPDLTTMADYLQKYIDLNHNKNEASADRYEKIYFQSVVETLLQIINGYDFGDEVGRNNLKTTIFDILKTVHINESVIKIMMQILENLITDAGERLQQVVELICSICDYNQIFDLEAAKKIVNDHLAKHPDIDLETQIRRNAVQILELRERESLLMNQKDYGAAQSISQDLESSIEEYKLLIKPIMESSTDEATVSLAHSLYRRKRLSNETLVKCMQIFFYMIASQHVKHLTPSTVELYRKLICVYFVSQEINLRNWALRCGTSCALLYESLSKEVFDALWKQFLHTGSVKIWRTTIQCMFELLDPYGFDHFNLEKEQNKTKRSRQLFSAINDDDENDEQESVGNFMNFMAQLTDGCEDPTIISVVAYGHCRLILRGHLSASEIIVKLLLKYFNPATENELSQSLGIFFENLIEFKKQELLQQALLPTVNAIFDAPFDSPLSEIDPKKVIRFVTQSTRTAFCAPGLCIHNTLAMDFLSTIKECDEENSKDLIKTLIGELRNLEISDDIVLRNDFKTCIEELKQRFNDAKITKDLMDFTSILDGKMTASVTSSRVQSTLTTCNGDGDHIGNGSDNDEDAIGDDEDSNPPPEPEPQPNNEKCFKVPLAKSIPDFMKNNSMQSMQQNLTIGENLTQSPALPDSPSSDTQDTRLSIADNLEHKREEEVNLTPFTIPSPQKTPKRNTRASQLNTRTSKTPKSTDEEVASSPVQHETEWSRNRQRGTKLNDKTGQKRIHESSVSQESNAPPTPPPLKKIITRQSTKTPDVPKRATRSASGINCPSLRKAQSMTNDSVSPKSRDNSTDRVTRKSASDLQKGPKTPIRATRSTKRT